MEDLGYLVVLVCHHGRIERVVRRLALVKNLRLIELEKTLIDLVLVDSCCVILGSGVSWLPQEINATLFNIWVVG